MPRSGWTDLPDEVRGAIEARIGPVVGARSATTGNHADVAATLETADSKVFVKAARKLDTDQDGPEVWSLRRESLIAPHVKQFAPRLLWQQESGGWLVLGFEHVPGRAADFAPGSPDLNELVTIIHRLQAAHCPDVVELRVEQRWASLADDVSPMAGDALLHTDLNPKNLIINDDDGSIRVVDWALASRGAAWVEVVQLMPWLIMAGHAPNEADMLGRRLPSWRNVAPEAVALHAGLAVSFWERRSRNHPAAWIAPYLAAWRVWADYVSKAYAAPH
ncbi:phosphotransferase [Actinomadura rupiterrae]|uniref:phosphotransferase n=1 Tax=Actinomadura rupiterrae TaxID=559627 RepID=UPI0020A5FA21|nr:phosphotransferase [Actinomadura rupiterrae]MCP2336956.1 hypothetical protein [Actinomadura rupiterrae]